MTIEPLYDPIEVLREIVEELDKLADIPVSGASMTRARQLIEQRARLTAGN